MHNIAVNTLRHYLGNYENIQKKAFLNSMSVMGTLRNGSTFKPSCSLQLWIQITRIHFQEFFFLIPQKTRYNSVMSVQ